MKSIRVFENFKRLRDQLYVSPMYSALRALSRGPDSLYTLEFLLLERVSRAFGSELRNNTLNIETRKSILKSVDEAILWDQKNFDNGIYPQSLRSPFSLRKHTQGFFNVLMDYPKVLRRRQKKDTRQAKEVNFENNLPAYFLQNFHHQTDGYTSFRSAKLYDHQVEILFAGTANLMRRLLVYLIKHHSKKRNFKCLELAAGTGEGGRIFLNAFPQSELTISDLSAPYLSYAKRKFSEDENVHFDLLDARKIKERKDQSFDLVFHIFLFHEMPQGERKKVMAEMSRLLKPGGLGLILDSLQTHDLDTRPDWKQVLDDFPKKYHEPYYQNYISYPLERLVAEAEKLSLLGSEILLFTKGLIFQKKL